MICPKCGKENKENFIFCINCGNQIADDASLSDQYAKKCSTEENLNKQNFTEESVKETTQEVVSHPQVKMSSQSVFQESPQPSYTQVAMPYNEMPTQSMPNSYTKRKKSFNIVALVGSIVAVCALFLPFIEIEIFFTPNSYSYINLLISQFKIFDRWPYIHQDFQKEILLTFIPFLLPVILAVICFLTAFAKNKATMIFAILTILSVIFIIIYNKSINADSLSIIDIFADLKIGIYVFSIGLVTNIIAKITEK